MKQKSPRNLSDEQRNELLKTLKKRFQQNKFRHENIDWSLVETRLISDESKDKMDSLNWMEKTGGEPDVVGYDSNSDEYVFMDCSKESPSGRRSLCYDYEARETRKKHKPAGNACDTAGEMGIKLLTEEEYKELQRLGSFDTKTSSWLATPNDVRNKGGAIFGDYRYGRVFIYHNGAESYYAARGFRGILRV